MAECTCSFCGSAFQTVETDGQHLVIEGLTGRICQACVALCVATLEAAQAANSIKEAYAP
jgi:hypothetical protein